MKLVGTMPVRNESWILGLSARVALMWCDELVILNHRSTDRSAEIMHEVQAEHPGRVHLLATPDLSWSEMLHREMMLDRARGAGATHIAIVDADEILTGNLIAVGPNPWTNGDWPFIGLYEPGSYDMCEMPGYNLRGSLHRYHANGTWGGRWFSTTFKDSDRLYWSSAGRGGYEHHHRSPMGAKFNSYRPVPHGRGGTMHLWGVTDRRLRAKHARYKMTERIKYPDRSLLEIEAMYSWWRTGCAPGEPFDWKFTDVPAEWWAPYAGLMKHLDLTAEPWEEQYCRNLWAHYGAATFKGLDLFGVVG